MGIKIKVPKKICSLKSINAKKLLRYISSLEKSGLTGNERELVELWRITLLHYQDEYNIQSFLLEDLKELYEHTVKIRL